MSERDELADKITTFRERWYGSIGGGSAKEDIDLANHLNAAGYRKPRTVTTAAELDALPVGAILLDGGRTPIRKEADGLWHWGEMPLSPGLILPCNPDGLTILHEGEK